MDNRSQVRHAAALAVGTATWLRDEEAAGSNPATPTKKASSGPVSFPGPPALSWLSGGSGEILEKILESVSRTALLEARGFRDSRTLIDGNPHRDESAEIAVTRVSAGTATFAEDVAFWMRGDGDAGNQLTMFGDFLLISTLRESASNQALWVPPGFSLHEAVRHSPPSGQHLPSASHPNTWLGGFTDDRGSRWATAIYLARRWS
jgi:hypothetical protein